MTGTHLFFLGIALLIVAVAAWLVHKMAFLLPDPAHFGRELDHIPAPPPNLTRQRDTDQIRPKIRHVAARPVPTVGTA